MFRLVLPEPLGTGVMHGCTNPFFQLAVRGHLGTWAAWLLGLLGLLGQASRISRQTDNQPEEMLRADFALHDPAVAMHTFTMTPFLRFTTYISSEIVDC